jgi:hypothetical protein
MAGNAMTGKAPMEGLNFLRLVERSQDLGDGWRQCSQPVWDRIVTLMPDGVLELVDINARDRQVRLTDTGRAVLRMGWRE